MPGPSSATSQPAPVVDAAIVTPTMGPPGQEPPGPLVVQNALVGAGSTAMTNVLTSGLTGDPDILKISAGLNVVAQIVKQASWFNEKLWTLPFIVLLGVAFACWYYRDPTHWDLLHPFWDGYLDVPGKGILNGLTGAFQASMNFHGLKATGVTPMPAVSYDRSVEAKSAAGP